MFSIPPTRLEEEHAIDCASQQQPGLPIYFASDSVATTGRRSRMLKAKARQKISNVNATGETVVVARRGNQDPLHLDPRLWQLGDWKNRSAADFTTFCRLASAVVESVCAAYGAGGMDSWRVYQLQSILFDQSPYY
jgi:hypothetical protein